MEYFLQQVINGLTLGSIYGLIAIGYTMVYGIIGMINFAHGDIFTVGAFMALIVYLAITSFFAGVPVAVTLLVMMAVAVVLTSLWNWTIERIAYRPLRGSFRLAPLIQPSVCRLRFQTSFKCHKARATSQSQHWCRATSRLWRMFKSLGSRC